MKACAAGALALAVPDLLPAAESVPPLMSAAAAGRDQPYYLGADISWLLEDEAQGATYWDRGVRKDLLAILKSYRFNSIRARLFVNPSAPGGYSRGGFCDLEHTKKLATRIRAAGMNFLLDFHYADTWTSPGHQSKPAAWASYNFDQLVNAVHDWTKTVLEALQANDSPPQMVQIGNETTDGILFPDGRMSDFDKFAELVNAGCKAAREVDPKIRVAVHNSLGREDLTMRTWVDGFLQRKTDFDIIGMSCYAEAEPGQLQATFNDLAVRYPHLSLMALEYSHKKRYVNDAMFNAPNGRGQGTFIWEPTRWREAIFDKGGVNAGDDDNNKPHLPASALPPDPSAVQEPAAALPPPPPPPTPPPTTMPGRRRRFNRGGRYDTNSYILLYPEMAKAYGLVS
jgi:arabinogalactan endo-1,4-beta-galactosidase